MHCLSKLCVSTNSVRSLILKYFVASYVSFTTLEDIQHGNQYSIQQEHTRIADKLQLSKVCAISSALCFSVTEFVLLRCCKVIRVPRIHITMYTYIYERVRRILQQIWKDKAISYPHNHQLQDPFHALSTISYH